MSVTAVIPAYNEEKYINNVLAPLKEINLISQIIVVSDGSTDGTVTEALKWGVQVIDLPHNVGKGGAMARGVQDALNDVILFLDADLIGLNSVHVINMINPILLARADMTIGVFDGGRIATDMAQVLTPFLSGQRCTRKASLGNMEEWVNVGFGIETFITQYAYSKNQRIQYVNLPEMSHVMKEEKLGFMRGFAYRLKMYWEIAKNVRMGG